ncbi:Rod shape-determining protein RodA [Dissulfuribacter thermophilus]|uniref:Peptidoglycan glycosyltransferase RodA n=1 Tax=Dissulfuribacter thermophilus TaxID=1156395 RepID=A0A1B9F6X2_9BACT|nr:rod shape-determining protein RodA [Dissulfuribacter thermophilus]OCC15687.1 Rod shape-determining protein RodA [Dissulfuribacter thermophilus]
MIERQNSMLNRFGIIKSIDWVLLGALFLIMGLGILNLYSASVVAHSPFYLKQIIWCVLGTLLMLMICLVDYRTIALYADIQFWSITGLLMLVLLVGRSAGGSQRWLDLGFFNLQPSEFAKIIMVIVFSKYFYENDKPIYGFKDLIKPAFFAAIPCLLILKQPDLGTAVMILMVLGTMVLVAKIRWSTFVTIFVVIASALPLVWKYLKPYQKRRIMTFLDPENDPFGSGYHIIQSKVAIGSGGLWGKGFMKGTQAHLSFLPEVHTDFAFSLWGEEWGFAGALFLVLLYAIVVYRGLKIAFESNERLGSFLAVGVTAMFFWQAVVNINMVIGLMPVVGVPLPLFSYGGSSVIVTLMGMGILLGVGSRKYFFHRK